MTGIAMARRWVALVVLGLGASLLAIVPGASPAAGQDDAVVTWPSVTAFNPTTYDYVIQTNYAGSGHLFFFSQTRSGEVNSNGPTTIPFGDGRQWITIYACPEPSFSFTCPFVAESPVLQVASALHGRIQGDEWWGPHEPLAPASVWPSEAAPDISWEIVAAEDPQGPVLLGGAVPAAELSGGLPPIGPTDLLEHDADYIFRAQMSADTPTFGPLQGSFERPFTWDTNPPNGELLLGDDVFYPVVDNYKDEVRIAVVAEEDSHFRDVRFVITDEAGLVVLDRNFPDPRVSATIQWRGRDEEGDILPEGDYRVAVTGRDGQLNPRTFEATLTLSHKQKSFRTWRRTFKPATSTIEKYIGRCARLARPARSGWTGSLGYRSSTRCRQFDDTVVATTHGAYVPYSPLQRYPSMRVSVTGGKALGERSSYLVLHYLNRDGKWIARRQLDARLATHDGVTVDGTEHAILGDWEDKKPYVIWTVGLGGGAKYDVKSFTVEVEYVVLE